jgi:hypothetical protein
LLYSGYSINGHSLIEYPLYWITAISNNAHFKFQVEDFTLKIILPEGAVIGKLNTPYPMKREADTKHFTYLDTSGRPVVNIRGLQDLTEKHIQDFQLEFTYPK